MTKKIGKINLPIVSLQEILAGRSQIPSYWILRSCNRWKSPSRVLFMFNQGLHSLHLKIKISFREKKGLDNFNKDEKIIWQIKMYKKCMNRKTKQNKRSQTKHLKPNAKLFSSFLGVFSLIGQCILSKVTIQKPIWKHFTKMEWVYCICLIFAIMHVVLELMIQQKYRISTFAPLIRESYISWHLPY